MTFSVDNAATATFAAMELEPPMTDWSVEDVQEKLAVFKDLAKMWPEMKGIPDHKQHTLIIQLLLASRLTGKKLSFTGNLSS